MLDVVDVFWQELPIGDLLRLCESNKSFYEICKRDKTWAYLLNRDFNIINYKGDYKIKYVTEYMKIKAKNRRLYNIEYDNNALIDKFYGYNINQIYEQIVYGRNNHLLSEDLENLIEDSLEFNFIQKFPDLDIRYIDNLRTDYILTVDDFIVLIDELPYNFHCVPYINIVELY